MDFNEITPEISEIAGLFAADGSMQKEHICFWGNPKADRDFYDKHLTKLFYNAFKINIRPHEKQSNYVYGFYICKKEIINFFNKVLEFPIGKKTYTVKVPKIIYHNDNKDILRAFLRGFLAGDGCLTFDKRRGKAQEILKIVHTYPRIQITSVSKEIILQLSQMLLKLNIKNTIHKRENKKENEVDSYMLQVSGKSRLNKWIKEIGFSNSNHYSRYEIFKRYGFVPPYTSYEERIKMIEGKLDPWSFYPKRAYSLVWIRYQPSILKRS